MDLDQQEVWKEICQLPTIHDDQGRDAIHSITEIGRFIDSLPEVKAEVGEELLQEVGGVGERMHQDPCTTSSIASPNPANYPYFPPRNPNDAYQPVEGESKTERSAH